MAPVQQGYIIILHKKDAISATDGDINSIE